MESDIIFMLSELSGENAYIDRHFCGILLAIKEIYEQLPKLNF